MKKSTLPKRPGFYWVRTYVVGSKRLTDITVAQVYYSATGDYLVVKFLDIMDRAVVKLSAYEGVDAMRWTRIPPPKVTA